MENAHILIVEDEEAIVTLLTYNLEKAGYKVSSTGDGAEAVMMVKEEKPDLIVLDWMLPSMSGIEVCKQLREDNEELRNIPIIMLSARGEEDDKITGLDAGADDYVVKPFSPNELIARINAVFRRIRPALAEKELNFENIRMDLASRRVYRDEKEIHLSPTEFGLLNFLMENPGRVFSREKLLDAVWGTDIYVELRTVDVHVRRLRANIDYDGKQQEIIRTVRAAGYALEVVEKEE